MSKQLQTHCAKGILFPLQVSLCKHTDIGSFYYNCQWNVYTATPTNWNPIEIVENNPCVYLSLLMTISYFYCYYGMLCGLPRKPQATISFHKIVSKHCNIKFHIIWINLIHATCIANEQFWNAVIAFNVKQLRTLKFIKYLTLILFQCLSGLYFSYEELQYFPKERIQM